MATTSEETQFASGAMCLIPKNGFYDDYGDLVQLKTYRGGSGWNGSSWPASPGTADTTTWAYQDSTGLLWSKTDALGGAVSYSYYTNRQLFTRTWARLVKTTNSYNILGDLERLDYSDGTPSVLFMNYNRAGQPRTIVDAAGQRTNLYDHASRLVSDTGVSNLFNGITVSNRFHAVYGRDMIKVLGLSSSIQHDYGYDAYGRLGSAGSEAYSASYGYLPNTDLQQTSTCKSNTTTVLTTSRAWDYGVRLQSIANVVSNTTVSSHQYLYDTVHRRTQATLEAGSIWKYDYNDRNELTSGKRYWNDWTPVAGQQFEYAFDNIGNRTTAKEGGDANGANLRSEIYTANALNQYSSRTNPGAVDVIGVAKATAAVTVNGAGAYERGEYYRCEATATNGSGPTYLPISVTATEGGNNTNQTGNILVPPATQSFTYDLDGNLTNDSVWIYSWDAENRLTQMTNLTTFSTTARKKLVFTYDFQGRRVTKKVYPWSGSNYSTTPETDTRFLYHGWNLIAELNATNNAVIRSYTWGQDLSGTMDGAGGIGGLLLVSEHFATPANYFACYDGNGNVIALVNAANNFISARYEYSAFGETIRATGPLSRSNPFGWSTKYCDIESGLSYYGQRYYNLDSGRWMNRDPIEEQGGTHLYAFVFNDPIGAFDLLGAFTGTLGEQEEVADIGSTIEGGGAGQAITFLNRVRDIVDTFNSIQQFTADIMDAAEGDTDELYADLLQISASALAGGFRRGSGLGISEMHHIFPVRFKDLFRNAQINIDKWKVRLERSIHKGIHQGGARGGNWNADWEAFLEGKKRTINEMFDFAAEMLQKYGIGSSSLK